MSAEDSQQLNIEELIEQIAPLNNLYRTAIKNRYPASAVVEIMWDVGDILCRAGVTKIHPIAWQIYGESSEKRRSYITRDFLSYCFRIRNYFNSREGIGYQLEGVPSYSVFREALPLLENPKFKLTKSEEQQLLALVRSRRSSKAIKEDIAKLKKQKGSRSNTRRQRLGELEQIRDSFARAHAELKKLMLTGTEAEIIRFSEEFQPGTLLLWNKACLSLSSEEFQPPTAGKGLEHVKEDDWIKLVNDLARISTEGHETRNRFRRLVRPLEIIEMGGCVNILRSRSAIRAHIESRP